MSEDDIKIKLSPYLGCSKKLTELFAIIGYEEEALKKSYFNKSPNPEKLKLTFLSIVISDISYEFDCNYLIKQVYPKKPPIIKSAICPKSDNIIFFSCIDSLTGDKKIVNSGYALRFFERIKAQNGDIYFIPKAFLIYSQYPYFSSYRRICEKILLETDERYADREFPIEIFIHCLVNYFPSPINNNLILKDFVPYIIIPKLTGYPYVDFNLGKVLTSVNLNDFIKIFILIFLEIDLIFFSPDLEKLNIFMFALYILNYPLTDTNYFWHIKTFSLEDIEGENLNEGTNTTFRGVNCEFKPEIDFSNFNALYFIIDIEDKKNPIINISDNKEAKNIDLLLKFLKNVLNGKHYPEKNFFLEKYTIKLQKNLNNILKEYNEIAINDSNIANSFFYMNKSIMKINRQIQEIFYDFILNILVELNKDYIINPPLKKAKDKTIAPKISAEEQIFMKLMRDSIKYNLYFINFITYFNAPDEIKISFLFSDEYVNLKKQEIFQNIEEKVEYFGIMDKLYILRRKDLKYDLKASEIEYSRTNFTPSGKTYSPDRFKKLFVLDEDIIKKFIYKKKNKNYYETFKEPDDIKIDTENKNSIIYTIQYYLDNKKLLKLGYYIRGSTAYLICLCFPFFPKQIIPFVLDKYLKSSKEIKYFQRHYIFILLKAINKYYQINKEKNIFPDMELNNIIVYYEIIYNHLKDNSIIFDEELDSFFKKHLNQTEENKNDNNNNNQENKFIYNLDDFIFEGDINKINKNYKMINQEINININNSMHKFNKIKPEQITELFRDIYLYYEFFVSKDFSIKNIDINKLMEKAANLIMFFRLYTDEKYVEEGNFIKILYNLISLLMTFQKLLSNLDDKKNEA